MVALQVYVERRVESWTVAGAFGQRRFVSITMLLVVGLAALATQLARTRRGRGSLLNVAIALCVWWNLALMAEFGTRADGSSAAELAETRTMRS